MRFFSVIFVIALFCLAGCATEDASDQRWNSLMSGIGKNNALPHANQRSSQKIAVDRQISDEDGLAVLGDGTFVNGRQIEIRRDSSSSGTETYTLNLVDAPVAEAAKRILGDIMGYNYLVDPRVRGGVTLETVHPVSKETLMSILETALAVNNAAIVKRDGRYDVVPASEASKSSLRIDVAGLERADAGLRLQVLPLRYISAEEMKNILVPITKKGAILRVDNNRNYLLVAGNSGELSAMRDAVDLFDVDFMKGMSVGLFPLKTAKPSDLVNELANVFANDGAQGGKLIRFIPNERLNSVMAITSRPEYLSKVGAWIRKLDRIAETNDEQLFVYEIQNRSAQDLAKVLQEVLAANSGISTADAIAPNLTPASYTAEGQAPSEASTQLTAPASTNQGDIAPRVVADVEKNSLLISTTAREYRRIERILAQLDVAPTQVFLEAVIAEVTLNDQLKFGVNWALEKGKSSATLSDMTSGAVASSFPGFSWARSTDSIQSVLNTISAVTKVKVISSPSLMVVNNEKATLQVGDQVPIVTQTLAGTQGANTAIVNSVEMKDTGVILNITPRINSSGRIMLDVAQEVSDVVQTTTSGIDSPTIRQRKISTRVFVADGESIALGGLIQERTSRTEKKLPVLGDVPLIGNAFKSKLDTAARTELIIFIRPRVVTNVEEARQITEEFRDQLDFGMSDTPKRRVKRDLDRILQ